MDELIRRVDVARPLLEKYREAKRQAERALKLRNLGSCLAFRSDMETLSACIQIAVEAPAMGEDGREILLDALEHYGERAQVDMMLEEMAELSKALLKLRRAQKFREPGQWLLMEDVAEEIADVQIVLDQMKMLYPMWDGFRRKKLQRLEERIEKERKNCWRSSSGCWWRWAVDTVPTWRRRQRRGGPGPGRERGGHVKRRSREYERLAALAAEAKRRGLSYGQLMAGTTEYERNQIVQKRRKT